MSATNQEGIATPSPDGVSLGPAANYTNGITRVESDRLPVSSTAVHVLLAALAQPRPTVRSLAFAVGHTVAVVHRCLRELRDVALVAWTEGDGVASPRVEIACQGGPTSTGSAVPSLPVDVVAEGRVPW